MPQLATIFVCGSSGNFWKSEDSGYSWEQITTGVGSHFFCCWGTSPSDVYVGSYNGRVYHYDGNNFTLDFTFSKGSGFFCSDIHGNSDGSEIWASLWGYNVVGPAWLISAKKENDSWVEYENDIYSAHLAGYGKAGCVGGIGHSNIVSADSDNVSAWFVFNALNGNKLASITPVGSIPKICGARETSIDTILAFGNELPTYGAGGCVFRGDGSSWSLVSDANSRYLSAIGGTAFLGYHSCIGNQIYVSPTDKIYIASKDYMVMYNGLIWSKTAISGTWRTCHGYNDENVFFVNVASNSNHFRRWNGDSFDDAITIGNFYPTGVYAYLQEDPEMTMFRLRNLKVHDAVETTFATEEASFSARDVQCVDVAKIDIAQDHLDDPTVVSDAISPLYKKILGLKNKTKLSFPVNLRGTGTAAGNATAAKGAADITEGQFLKNFFGTETLNTGSTAVASGSDVDTIVTASGAGFTAGNAVLINGEASPILSVNSNTLELTKALTSAPAQSDVVYASATYTPNKTISGLTQQFRAYTGEDDYWKLLGCQLASLKLSNLGPGQLPRMDLEWMVSSWTKATGGALTTPTFINVATTAPIPGYASYFHMQTYLTTTKNHLNVSSFSLDFGMDAQQMLTISGGVQSVQSYVRSKIAPTFELTLTSWDTTSVAAWANQTKVSILYQIGSTAGNTILIDMRECYIEMQEEANVNSQLGVKVKGYAIGTVPVRLHLL